MIRGSSNRDVGRIAEKAGDIPVGQSAGERHGVAVAPGDRGGAADGDLVRTDGKACGQAVADGGAGSTPGGIPTGLAIECEAERAGRTGRKSGHIDLLDFVLPAASLGQGRDGDDGLGPRSDLPGFGGQAAEVIPGVPGRPTVAVGLAGQIAGEVVAAPLGKAERIGIEGLAAEAAVCQDRYAKQRIDPDVEVPGRAPIDC